MKKILLFVLLQSCSLHKTPVKIIPVKKEVAVPDDVNLDNPGTTISVPLKPSYDTQVIIKVVFDDTALERAYNSGYQLVLESGNVPTHLDTTYNVWEVYQEAVYSGIEAYRMHNPSDTISARFSIIKTFKK